MQILLDDRDHLRPISDLNHDIIRHINCKEKKHYVATLENYNEPLFVKGKCNLWLFYRRLVMEQGEFVSGIKTSLRDAMFNVKTHPTNY